jgi:ADP-heptose:LPS heptosyltransferase
VKRPDLNLLSQLVAGLQKQHGLTLLLMGAPFEREVNQEFIKLHKANSQEPAFDLAGETSILQLVGLINACELVVSSDSGPYHMAVALGVRTLAVFKFDSPTHFHSHPWVRCCLAPDIGSLPALQTAAAELMAWKPTQDRAV